MVNEPSSEISTDPGLKAFTTVRGPGVGLGAIETLGELLRISLLPDFDELLPELEAEPELLDLSDDELPDFEPKLPDEEPEPPDEEPEPEPELPVDDDDLDFDDDDEEPAGSFPIVTSARSQYSVSSRSVAQAVFSTT
jgi:hypothetical protein